jgi:hypothetical protein
MKDPEVTTATITITLPTETAALVNKFVALNQQPAYRTGICRKGLKGGERKVIVVWRATQFCVKAVCAKGPAHPGPLLEGG